MEELILPALKGSLGVGAEEERGFCACLSSQVTFQPEETDRQLGNSALVSSQEHHDGLERWVSKADIS